MRLSFAVLAALPLLAATPALACPNQIEIARGDTLSAVAAACGTSVDVLMRANPGLQPTRLQPGMIVDVPSGVTPRGQIPYNRSHVRVAPPITSVGPGIQTPTNIQGREIRRERPLYVDPNLPLPGQFPRPGQPGSPGHPLPLR